MTTQTHRLHILVLVAAVASCAAWRPGPAHALGNSRAWQADCVLNHVGSTRSPFGVSLIRQACNYLSLRANSLHARDRAYQECILSVVPGSQSDVAANSLASACRARFR